jgi:cell division protein FtsW (lipid II flippase)
MTEQGKAQLRLCFETAIWLAIAIGMWIYSNEFSRDWEAYRFGAVSWPRAILIMMAVFAVAHLIVRMIFLRKHFRNGTSQDLIGAAASEDAGTVVHDRESEHDATTTIRIVGTFALPLIYLWLMPHLGYFVTTPFFIATYMVIFREQDWRYILGSTVLIYVGVLLIFSKLLYVPLPTGNLPGFYDFSNWLLEVLQPL